MANIMDYLDWRGDLPLTVSPFNEVDGLILAELSFINFEGIVPPPGTYFARHNGQEIDMGVLVPGRIPDLMCRMAHSVRFGGMLLNGYCELMDDAREQQFAALTVELGDGSIYLSYRGTDDTIVGWKEDFNMSFLSAVPAQVKAAEYAGAVARACPRRALRIGGHSKGGNLAAWAAIYLPAELQKDRLLSAYNNDGPGFAQDMLDTPEYRRVADKLHTYIPESSIVGVLLEHAEDYAVIDSANRSIMQHEPLSWSVVGTRFVHLGQRSQMGRLSDDVLREWIGSMTPAEREQFTDALFDVLSLSGKARTLDDLRSGGLAGGAALLKQYAGADEEKKKIIAEIFRRLAVDVKDELKRAAGEGLEGVKKAAGEGLEGVKTVLTNLTKGEK